MQVFQRDHQMAIAQLGDELVRYPAMQVRLAGHRLAAVGRALPLSRETKRWSRRSLTCWHARAMCGAMHAPSLKAEKAVRPRSMPSAAIVSAKLARTTRADSRGGRAEFSLYRGGRGERGSSHHPADIYHPDIFCPNDLFNRTLSRPSRQGHSHRTVADSATRWR